MAAPHPLPTITTTLAPGPRGPTPTPRRHRASSPPLLPRRAQPHAEFAPNGVDVRATAGAHGRHVRAPHRRCGRVGGGRRRRPPPHRAPPGTDCSTECTAHVGKLRGGAHLELRLSPIFDGAAAAPVGSFVPLVVRTPAESGSRPRLPSSHVSLLSQDPNDLPADLVSDYMPPPVARRVITAAATPPVATATCSPACSKGGVLPPPAAARRSACATWASAARRAPTATRASVSSTASSSPASPASPPSTARPSSWSRASRRRRRRRPPPPSAARPTPCRRCAPRAHCSSPRSSIRRGRPTHSPTSSSPSAT